jgi:hypothetical protein
MKLEIPDVQDVVTRMLKVEASFGEKKKEISEWVERHRSDIKANKGLVADNKYIEVLCRFLPDLLIRGMSGEAGSKVRTEIERNINEETDLTDDVYKKIIKNANYRWGEKVGVQVIKDVVRIFQDEYRWDWKRYFQEAEDEKEMNFSKDKLLGEKVKYIRFKVRDLALSGFNENYIAIDRHVVRVITRLGFLNYGFELLENDDFEMGTNPMDEKNYLFLHRLTLRLSDLTDSEYTPSDLDRILWHFGRSKCGAKPECGNCSVAEICPTGKIRNG